MKLSYELSNQLKLEIYIGSFVRLDESWNRSGVCDAFSRLYFIQSGRGWLIRETEYIPLEPGYAYLIPSGCRFSYGCESMDKLFFHVALTAQEGMDLLEELGQICRIPYPQAQLEQLLQEDTGDYWQLIRLKGELYRVICQCIQMCRAQPLPVRQYSPLVQNAIGYIRANLSIKLTAGEVAGALFVSESRLRKAFREQTGMPIGKYVDNLVFLRAKQLLMEQSLPIGQISQSLGFCDQFYFSRRFKECFLQTPSQFRREVLKNAR